MPDYLVQYGTAAFVGRFTADNDLSRGASVVVRSLRGLEIGCVLCETKSAFDLGGEIVRVAATDDERNRATANEMAARILDAANLTDQAVTFLDCEVTLDRRGAILHALPWGECQLDGLLADLSERFGTAVRLHDVSRTETRIDPVEPKTTCEKPGCGTAEGGCSSCSTGACGTGSSCSKGKVESAAQLTSYFADLRQKMEEQTAVRTPLN